MSRKSPVEFRFLLVGQFTGIGFLDDRVPNLANQLETLLNAQFANLRVRQQFRHLDVLVWLSDFQFKRARFTRYQIVSKTSKEAARSQHFAGVHDPARIEGRFDGSHRFDGGSELAAEGGTLAETDAVFAGASAIESEGVSYDLVAETLDFGKFLGGVRINREHDVKVAVTDMPTAVALRRQIATQTSVT